jgi:hypothetical protein
MVKKKKIQHINTINYILPSDDNELTNFAQKFKIEMMEQIVGSIEFALQNKLKFVEVFQFKNSDFVITLSEKDYLTNLENIFNYYIKNEAYEYCPRVTQLQKTLIGKSNINNEKQRR